MKSISFILLALCSIGVVLSTEVANAQSLKDLGTVLKTAEVVKAVEKLTGNTQAPVQPKPTEPKNGIGLTQTQTKNAINAADICAKLAKEMADGKKRYSDLNQVQQQTYNDCETLLGNFFLNFLQKQRDAVTKVTQNNSTQALAAAALLLMDEHRDTLHAFEIITELQLHAEVAAVVTDVSGFLVSYLEEVDRGGYFANVSQSETDVQSLVRGS